MSFSIGDFFPLRGSRRAASVAQRRRSERSRETARKGRDKSSAFRFEHVEPRVLLSADSVVGNLSPTLLNGLTQVGNELHQLIDNPAVTDDFDKLVPGIVETLTLGDNSYQVSPTLADALSIRADVDPSNFPLSSPSDTSLAGRYAFIDGLDGTLGVIHDEFALRAMDLDAAGTAGHGKVSIDEAFKVLVAGQLQDYLASTTIANQDGDADVDARDLAIQVRSFLLTLDNVSSGNDWQSWLSDRVILDVDGASWSYKNDTLTWTLDYSLTLKQSDVFDLGYEAASLGIGIDPGSPPSANTNPYKLPVTRTADFASFSFGVRNVSGGVGNDDFFFAAPADGVRIGVNLGTPGTPYTAGLDGLDVNVGFLGAEFLSTPGYGIVLDMDVVGGAVDPSHPSALGFSAAQLGALQTGSVEAANLVDLSQLGTTPIDFTLKLGTDAGGVERIVVLPQGPYTDAPAVVVALNAALTAAGFGGLVTASDADTDSRIELTVVATDPSPLGFVAETGAVGQITGTPTALVGKTAAQLAANPDASFLLVRTDTLTGVTEFHRLQVNVTTFSDDQGNADPTDDLTTLTDVRDALNAAANAAFTASITVGTDGSDLTLSSAGGTVEITRKFTVDVLDQITLAELQGAAQVFDMDKDGAAAFDVNLKLKALAGLEDENDVDYRPEGTIKVDIDPFSASDVSSVVIDVDPPTGRPIVSAKYELTDAADSALSGGASDLQTLLDFNVIGVADILGIFSQLSNWFDQVSASDLMQGFDIPFADSTLGSLLNFKDLISDSFLIDDRDDGPTKQGAVNVKDAPKLLEWIGAAGKEQLRPRFGNAQQLAARLDEILPGDSLAIDATVFRDGSNRQNLTYRLSIGDIALDVDPQTDGDQALTVPLDFEIDLGPVANFETSGKLAISATGDIGMTVGIVLGNAVDVLDGATTDVASLNSDAGVTVNTNLALTSLGVIEPLVGRLTAGSHFTVLTTADGTTWTEYQVTLAKSATDNNLSLNDPSAADPSTRLLTDLNAALATAGLTGKIVAESDPIQGTTRSARLVLRALDPAIRQFQVLTATNDTAFTELGLRAQRAATVSLVAPEPIPSANPGGDVSLTFEIERAVGGPLTPTVILPGAATSDNVALQSLIDDLNAILPAGIAASQSGGRLVLSAVDANITAFTVGNADALGLKVAVANAALQDQGVSAGAVPAKLVAGALLRGGAAPADPFGRLAAPVSFTINGQAVTVTVADTAANTSIDDLVRDLNEAIEANASLKGQVAAVNDGNRIVLRVIDKDVATITVAGLSVDESTALGLADGASAGGLKLRSSSLAPVSYGVSQDTAFTVTVNGVGHNATLLAANTIGNRSLFDLAASLNGAISLALGGATKNPLLATAQSGQIVIGLKTTSPGSSLIGDPAGTVNAGDGVIAPIEVTSFSLNSADARFADQLRLISAPSVANVADKADLVISFSDNSSPLRVTLDALDTDADQKLDGKLGALISAIVSAPGAAGRVSVGFGSGGTSLKLTDNTWVDGGPNPGTFTVAAVNGSPAAAQLGILGGDTASININEVAPVGPGGTVADGVIDGGRIATIDLIDRVYFQDVGATASLTVKTVGKASAEASFGFAGIRVESSDNQMLFSAEADLPLFDGPTTLAELFDALTATTGTTLASLMGTPTLTLGGDFTLDVSLQPNLAMSGFTAPAAAKIKFLTDTVVLDFDTINAAPAVGKLFPDLGIDIQAIDFGDLLKFEDITFDNVLDAVQAVADFLNQFESFGFLSDEIPLLGLSVNDLLGVADQFQAAVEDFRENPTGGIQQLAQRIREAFGLPEFASDAEAKAFLGNFGIDTTGLPAGFQMIQFALVGNVLKLDLRLPVGFSRALNVDLDLGSQSFLGGALPVDIQGGAGLAASGFLDARLSFGIDLGNPTNLLIYDDQTKVVGHFGAGANNLQFNASIGPMGAFIKDGRVNLALDFSASNDDADGNPESLGTFLSGLGATLGGTASATLPVFFPTDSQYLGDIEFGAGFTLDSGDGLSVNTTTFEVPDFSAIDLSAIDPFGSVPLMLDTLDFFLMGLQDVLDGEVLGVKLPLIGEQLKGGVGFIEDLRRDLLTPLRQYVEQAPELATDIVQALLFELLGPNSAQGMVDVGAGPQSIESLLGIAGDLSGLNLLKDSNGNATIDQGDVQTPTVADGAEWRFKLGGSYPLEVPLDFDLGIDALAFDMNTALIFGLDWTLGIGLGISKADGAYLYVGDTDELQLTLSIDVANSALSDPASIRGELGFLQLEVWEDGGAAAGLEGGSRGTYLQGSFKVDLKGVGADTKVSFSELGSLDADVKVSADAEVNLFIKAAFNEDLLPPTISALLPGVSGRFVLDWQTPDNIAAGNVDFGNSLSLVGFRGVTVDMGSFITDLIQPFVEKIAEVTEPLQPIIDVITAPIPVISDLAGQPISLVDIAGATGYVDPGLIYAVADIITLVNKIGSGSYGAFGLPLGDFMLIDLSADGTGTTLLTGAALTMPGYRVSSDSKFDGGADGGALKTFVNASRSVLGSGALPGFDSLLSSGSGAGQDESSKNLVKSLNDGNEGGGFAFPVFDHPELLFGLLLGKDIPLITYDLAPFSMDFSYVQKFPVWDALFVRIGGSVGLSIDLAFGYDTAGVREFAEGGFSNPLDLLGGLYVSDTNQPTGEGVDVPELILKGELFAGAELNLGVASAGAEGVIGLVVNFDLYDPDSDGKVRIDELVGNFLYEWNYGSPALAPIAIFDVYGEVYAQLRAFVESVFFKIEFEITPPITLFEFSIPFERQPFLATERGDGSLLLNIGPNAAQRLNGDTRDIDETIYVESVSDSQVRVWGMGIDRSDAQTYKVNKDLGIFGYGGQGNDLVDLSLVTHDIRYTLEGGAGDDTLLGTAGGGTMRGDAGNDKLTGGAKVDLILGGEGNDTIFGKGDADRIFGDSGTISAITGAERFRSFVDEKDGDDRISGDAGNDIIFGGGGLDWIEGGIDNDIVVGDGGNFDLVAGALTRLPAVQGSRYDVTVRGPGAKDTIFGNAGTDALFGGAGDDLIDGGADDDEIEAGDGFDVVYGGSGADLIYGGNQNDTIFGFRDPQGAFFGQPGEVGDVAVDGIDTIYGEEGNDFIRGNGANDLLYGGRGADILFGDQGDDRMFGEAGGDILFGGADNDTIDGADGADIAFGDDGLVVYIGFDPAATGFDITGSRVRYLATADALDGTQLIGDSDKALIGGYEAMADAIETSMDLIVTRPLGTDGSDTIIGGEGNDIVFGGGSSVGVGFDSLFGDFDPGAAVPFTGPRPSGQDIMVGDGGRVELTGRRNARAAAVSDALDGVDKLSGNDGGDYMFGGGASDEMHGFEAPGFGNAPLEGVADNDVMLGDNGEILLDPTEVKNRIKLVRTTFVVGDSGRSDTMYGTFGNDVMFGGLNGSSDVIEGGLGQDILVGDQGEIRFDLDGNLDTLDLIRSYRDGLGGADIVSGGQDADVLIGGTAGDTMYGDNAGATSGAADGEDIMLGDNGDVWLVGTAGRLTVKVAAMPTGSAVDLITATDENDLYGGADTMSGNARADIVIGGVNAGGIDRLYGDRVAPTEASIALDGNDILIGDNALLDFTYLTDTDRQTLDLIRSFEDGLGGSDTLSGNKGADVGIGGTGGDTVYGDDLGATAGASDGSDALIGDNADIFLVAAGTAAGVDLRLVLDAAVKTIRTTDEEHPEYGGMDTISGNAKGDIIAGGVQGDLLYGDAAAPVDGLDGNDVMLGDNAALEWLSTGRLNEIRGIDIAANNPALWAKYGTAVADGDLGTLDLITTEQPNSGARDLMFGNAADDIMAGGTDVDEMHGSAGNDAMFGDHARLYPQFSFVQVGTALVASPTFASRNYFAIDTRAVDGGQGDRMWGDAGDDVMLGQQGDDRMWGGDDDDDMIGGHNVSGTYAAVLQSTAGIAIDEFTGVIAAELQSPDNFMNDAMDGGAGDDAMTGDNAIVWRRGDDLSPRFRVLTEATIYTTDADTITVNVGATPQSDPEDADGRDIQLVDHADDTVAGLYGWDVMAGGADNDVMYGQLGDDLMQGDGSISLVPATAPPWVVRQIDVTDSAGPTDGTLHFNVPEAASDGDDYMEGNGGRDLMYGGLGQDDMIGGSSALFGLKGDPLLGLTDEQMRPDSSDTMFGGAGVDIARNVLGDAHLGSETVDGVTSTDVVIVDPTGHARDADFMMGDNANVYRVVAPAGDVFRTFNYDNYAGGLRIVPRAMEQLDYTLGGSDFAGGSYNALGQAQPGGWADNGAADLMHGESGDDILFGMTGSDVMFGEGQDDDLIGGYGHDWISGGTGRDGVLGDDGLVYTSRNSTVGEALYGVAGLLASDPSTKYSNGNVLDELVATPGNIQSATINKSGELKKTADLVPFSFDPVWMARDDEFPDNEDAKPFADDVIFGGWGSDWLHGGSGDDAISGAEALDDAYVPTYGVDGKPNGRLDLGYDSVGIASALVVNPTTQNPGNVLFFHAEDGDGQHLNNRFRAGEFDLYDEYNPRAKILLNGSGVAVLDGNGQDFLLNFDKDEAVLRPAGNVPKATGQQTESYPAVHDDGADAIFGDLGNDWIVGGTGRDNMYGGWGNDLLQADDNLDTDTVPSGPHAGPDLPYDNEAPDTHPTYEDRAYGGAGRDVIIGNTGGDRLIDWVGEYNSYIVPYAPFGQASVSRTLQPFLPEFLYALSSGDGADPTRYWDALGTEPPQPTKVNDPIPSRNGEPYGELGLVLQKDFAWGDQTGAPADPQAGNIPGGPRDVLRSADFAGNNANGFVAASGTWRVANGVYEVAPSAATGSTDAVSLFNADVAVPSYFELTATINGVKPIAGYKANAYIVFDYFGPDDFKFAGIDLSNNKIQIGQRTSAGWQVLAFKNMLMKAGTDYNVLVAVNGTAVTLVVNNALSVNFAFAPRVDADGFTYAINAGMFGLGADNAKARIDNVVLQRIPPKVTLSLTDEFDGTASPLLTPYLAGFTVQGGRLVATPAPGAPFAIATNDIAVSASAMLKLEAVLSTTGVGGVVFDLYSPTDFKWAAVSKATNQVLVGHYTAKAGWVVDAAVARTIAAGDHKLTVTLKDTTVSVSLDGQLVLSRIYNAAVVDGAIGALASGGATSFERFTFQTDDVKFDAASGAVATATGGTATSATTTTARSTASADPVPTSGGSTTTSAEAEPIDVSVPVTTSAETTLIDWSATLASKTTESEPAGVTAAPAGDWRSAFVTNLGVSYRLSSLNQSLSLIA